MSKVPVVRLGDIAKVVSGGTPSRANPAYWGGDIPWVKTAEIRNGRIAAADIGEHITEAGLKGSSARIVPEGSILMAMYGQGATRGRVTVLDVDAAISQNSVAFVLGGSVCGDYLFQVLRGFYTRLRSRHNAGSLEFLSTRTLLSLRFPLPPLPEQRRIADILAAWDLAIENTERLIGRKRDRCAWIQRELVDRRCAEWPHCRVDSAFEVRTQRVTNGAEPLAVTQDRGVIPRRELDRRIAASDESLATYKQIRPGEFAVSLRSFEGGIEYSEFDGGISAAYTVLAPRESADPEFYRYFFKSNMFVGRYLAESVIGIRDGKQVDIPGMLTTRIPVPPLDEQRRIAVLLRQAPRDVDLQTRLLRLLQAESRWVRGVLL